MKQKTNWWVDLVLFVGFIIAFFLDITGLEFHQWLGVFIGAIALYHLAAHWNWVNAVSKRFFTKTSGKARTNYVIDAGLLLGFILIVATGLVISTWADLYLDNYFVWVNVHILVSITTLTLTAVKLVIHWQWIAMWTKRSVPRINWVETVALAPASSAQPVKVRSNGMGRREFLQVISTVGAASMLAVVSGSDGLEEIEWAVSETNTGADDLASSGVEVVQVKPTQASTAESTEVVVTEEAATEAAVATAEPTQETIYVQPVNQSSSTTTTTDSTYSSSCTVRCNRGCSYPGHCHKYQDSNGNNLCDLGECI